MSRALPASDRSEGAARTRPVRIGLTGPIGCGKSTVAGWLAELGAVVIDADDVTREVMGPGKPVLEPIFERFGEHVRHPDGSLDRAALGRLVFSDPAALADLEAITHPAIRPALEAAIAAAEAAHPPALVLEAIKLVEAGYAAGCDEVWVVTCERSAQHRRLVGRGLDPATADQRIGAQPDLAARLAPSATRIIRTDGPAEAVRAEVVGVYRRLMEAARPDPGPSAGSRPAGR